MFGEELLSGFHMLEDVIAGYAVRGLKGAVGTQMDQLSLFGGDAAKVAELEGRIVAHLGIPEALMPVIQTIPVGKGIAGAAAERREPVELCNLQTDTSGVAKPGAKQTQVQGSLAVPVLEGDRLAGFRPGGALDGRYAINDLGTLEVPAAALGI